MSEDRRSFAFGPYLLEPARGRLLLQGAVVALPPKIFETLTQLVRADGRLVTKEELLSSIWPGTFVEEGSLTYTISTLRRLLGDDQDAGFIVTVPKRGYRFGAPISVIGDGPELDPTLAAPSTVTPLSRPTRLLVLPFRMLRADRETDFLSIALPDSIAGALSGLQSLVVRARLDAVTGDAAAIAVAADVDLALTGSLLRSGDQLRVSARLVEAGSGTLMWSQNWDVTLGDLFRVQDELQQRIVESLAVPLTATDERRLSHRGPATARAYEFYLRANRIAYDSTQWETARDLLLQCVEEDPAYAPAWARLARCYRLIGKFARRPDDARDDLVRADDAFRRALALNPELSVAHNLYAQLEVDLGRAPAAMARLLDRAAANPNDPETFAGLVAACRFCGLVDASIRAHARARSLDAQVPTSVAHSYWLHGDTANVLAQTRGDIGYLPALALIDAGRGHEALAGLRWREEQTADNRARLYLTSLRALLEERREESVAALCQLAAAPVDAEALFYVGRTFVYWSDLDRANEAFARAVDGGYYGAALERPDQWLEPIVTNGAFLAMRERASVRRDAATRVLESARFRLLEQPFA